MNGFSIAHGNFPRLPVALILVLGFAGCSPAGKSASSKPYYVAETENQPAQFLVQVVVPAGSTHEQVQNWHRQVKSEYAGRGKPVFVNYYDGRYEVSRLIANARDGEVGWIGLD